MIKPGDIPEYKILQRQYLQEFDILKRHINQACLRGKVVNSLEITDIRIKKIASEGKMKAVVSVTFDNAFVVHDIKIIEGQDKLFTAMPSRKTPDNEFKDIAHPINSQMRDTLESAILNEFDKYLASEVSVAE